MRMHKHLVLPAFALLGAAALAAAACSPAGSKGGEDHSGGPLVVARTVDLDQLDPAVATAFGTIQTLQLTFDTLLRTDSGGRLVPGLAKTWEASRDGRTLTFHLQPGVRFHNGDPLTADAVVATIDRVRDEATASVVRSNLLSVVKVTAPDPATAVITLSKPDVSVLDTLTLTGTSILDPADIKADRIGKAVNGTGPFKLAGRTHGQKVDLTANAAYFGGKPSISGVEFRVIPDETSILAGLRAGSFDAGVLTDPNVTAQVHGGLKAASTPSLAYHALMLNGRRKPLDDIAVRQAIACAVDRKQVVDTAVAGQGTVTGPITSPGLNLPVTDGLPCKPGDTTAAKKLLAKAGVSTPISLKTLVMSGGYASAINEAQNLQAQLSAIGVKLVIDQQPTNVYVKRWTAADYDATLALNGGNSSPYLMYARYFTQGASLARPAGLDSPKIAELLGRANTETDPKVRNATFAEVQRTMLEQSPWVWLFTDNNVVVTQPGVKGLTITADNFLRSLERTVKG
jgi:peptide/nickel transport system substrate-binding protein